MNSQQQTQESTFFSTAVDLIFKWVSGTRNVIDILHSGNKNKNAMHLDIKTRRHPGGQTSLTTFFCRIVYSEFYFAEVSWSFLLEKHTKMTAGAMRAQTILEMKRKMASQRLTRIAQFNPRASDWVEATSTANFRRSFEKDPSSRTEADIENILIGLRICRALQVGLTSEFSAFTPNWHISGAQCRRVGGSVQVTNICNHCPSYSSNLIGSDAGACGCVSCPSVAK